MNEVRQPHESRIITRILEHVHSPRSRTALVPEVAYHAPGGRRVTVRVRGFRHSSAFSFELDENHTISNLGPVETGAAG